MSNNWEEYRLQYHKIAAYVSDFRKKHGVATTADQLMYQLARLRGEIGDLPEYIRKFKIRHGRDGLEAVIEDLMVRLARQRANISEGTEYGK
jgi:hypothetical protein